MKSIGELLGELLGLPVGAPHEAPSRPEQRRELARQRCFDFVNHTYIGKPLERRLLGLAGGDPEHDEQWWFDHVDADRKRRNWRADGIAA